MQFFSKAFLVLIITLLILVGCEKNDEPTPAKTTETDLTPIPFPDNFSDNKNHWPVLNNDTVIVAIKNDSLFFVNKKVFSAFSIWKDANIDTTKDFVIKTSLIWKSGVDTSACGLVWGAKNKNNKYTFLVRKNGRFKVDFDKDSVKTYLKEWTSSSAINSSNNVLEIKKVNRLLYFKINNEQVFASSYFSFFGQGVGFKVENETSIAADYLNITQ